MLDNNGKNKILYFALVSLMLCNSIYLWKTFHCIYQHPSLEVDFNHYFGTAWMIVNNIMPYGVRFDSTPIANQFIWHNEIMSPTNPPLLALATSFLALFDRDTAWLLWIFIIILSICASYGILRHELSSKWPYHLQLLQILVIVCHSSVLENLFLSQIQSIIFMYVLLGWAVLRRYDSCLGGACWGISIALKYYTLPLLLLLFVAKRPKALATSISTLILLSLVPPLLMGKDIYLQFVHNGANIIHSWIKSAINTSFLGSINLISVVLNLNIPTNVIIFCVSILMIILTTYASYIIYKYKQPTVMFMDWSTALFMIISFSGTLLAWHSYYIYVVFIVTLIIQYNEESYHMYVILFLLTILFGNICYNGFLLERFRPNAIRMVMPFINLSGLIGMLCLGMIKLRRLSVGW